MTLLVSCMAAVAITGELHVNAVNELTPARLTGFKGSYLTPTPRKPLPPPPAPLGMGGTVEEHRFFLESRRQYLAEQPLKYVRMFDDQLALLRPLLRHYQNSYSPEHQRIAEEIRKTIMMLEKARDGWAELIKE